MACGTGTAARLKSLPVERRRTMLDFELEVHSTGGLTVLTPKGEVDIATSVPLKEALNDLILAGRVDLVIDLSEVTFLDSTALGVLIGTRRKVHAFKGSLVLVCDNERLMRLFTSTSLDKVFTFYRTLSEALPAETPTQ
jgi:anti-sigma B factor antagonist